jgi:hypothetical protein
MNKLLVILLVTIAPMEGALAQGGCIAIYSDSMMTSCCADIPPYGVVDLYLFYIREEGPELGPFFEFRIKSTTDDMYFLDPEFAAGCEYAGMYSKGFHVLSDACLDSGSAHSYLGKIPVLNMGDPDTFTISIEGSTYPNQEPAIFVSYCGRYDNRYPVCGGSFLFNGTHTECYPACPIRPRLIDVLILNELETRLRFTKELDPVTAEDPGNFSIGRSGHRFPVADARLLDDGTTVIITNSEPFHRGYIYGTAMHDITGLDGSLLAPRTGGTSYYGSDLWAKSLVITSHRCGYYCDIAYTIENDSHIGARSFTNKIGIETIGGSFTTLAVIPCDTLGPYETFNDTITLRLSAPYSDRRLVLYTGFHDDEHQANKRPNKIIRTYQRPPGMDLPVVQDVEGDNGGCVDVSYYSNHSGIFPGPITHYEFYRRAQSDSGACWELVDTMPHVEFNHTYHAIASTAADYIMGEDIPWEVFKVRAATANPACFMESCPDSGYSIGDPLNRSDVPDLPLTLYQNFPNPFNPSTTFRYFLPEKCHVILDVFDIRGQKVASVVNTEQDIGAHSIVWDGRNDQGTAIKSGVYVYHLQTSIATFSRKLIIVR